MWALVEVYKVLDDADKTEGDGQDICMRSASWDPKRLSLKFHKDPS